MCLHPCVSLNNEKICREISEHKIAVCEKTAGLRSGNSSNLNVLVPERYFRSKTPFTRDRIRMVTISI